MILRMSNVSFSKQKNVNYSPILSEKFELIHVKISTKIDKTIQETKALSNE